MNKRFFAVVIFLIFFLTSCTTYSYSISTEEDQNCESTSTLTSTITNTPTPTKIPTRNSTPTRTPTPTEVYEIEYTINGWPVIAGMEFEDYTETRPDAYDKNLFIIGPLFADAYDTTSPLATYILGDDLPDDLLIFIEEIYLEEEMELRIVEGDNTAAVYSTSFREKDMQPSEYAYDRLTSLQICQFAEAATIRGYGLVVEYGYSIEEAFQRLISRYGGHNSYVGDDVLYCPNFDHDSPMFLLILQDLGYYDLVEELRGN